MFIPSHFVYFIDTVTQSSTPMGTSNPTTTISPSQSTIIYTFIIIYFHLLIIADGTSLGAVLGGVAAAVLLLCGILAITICVWRWQKSKKTGIVHTLTCMCIFKVTDNFTILCLHFRTYG